MRDASLGDKVWLPGQYSATVHFRCQIQAGGAEPKPTWIHIHNSLGLQNYWCLHFCVQSAIHTDKTAEFSWYSWQRNSWFRFDDTDYDWIQHCRFRDPITCLQATKQRSSAFCLLETSDCDQCQTAPRWAQCVVHNGRSDKSFVNLPRSPDPSSYKRRPHCANDESRWGYLRQQSFKS